MTSPFRGLEPLCDWARCLNCGTPRPAVDPTVPDCCAHPVVLSAWTTAPKQQRLTLVDDDLKPAARRVRDSLLSAGPRGRSTHELCQPEVGGERFGGRIHELRKAGYVIHSHYERPGSHRYIIDQPQERAA